MTQPVDPWQSAKAVIGTERVLLGPQLSQQLLTGDHWVLVGARYRAAAALIGSAANIVELGCGEGIGAGILSKGRETYYGIDSDADSIGIAHEMHGADDVHFRCDDFLSYLTLTRGHWEAVVSLDVLEHVPAEDEDEFLQTATGLLTQNGVLVVGTPSKYAEQYASPQSAAGHINVFTPDRLRALMAKYFHTVQLMGMQDTAVHFGHPGMFHYVIAVGHGPR